MEDLILLTMMIFATKIFDMKKRRTFWHVIARYFVLVVVMFLFFCIIIIKALPGGRNSLVPYLYFCLFPVRKFGQFIN